MTRPVTTDANAIAAIVTGLGGEVIPGRTFRFDLPKEMVREVIPKINELGIACRNVGERTRDHPTQLRCSQTICTIELHHRTEKPFNLPNW
jgi:hypothetical protein